MSVEEELRRGPWSLEEDVTLIQYIASHGEGHWNLLAKSSGLKRTGKSCRIRWLNCLKPDIKRGNLTTQEKSTISELHSIWGNRWSKIAHHLPGRTDNEIKNYWRRTQNQARQLKQTNEDTTIVIIDSEKAKDGHVHHFLSSSTPSRNSAFPTQDGCSSSSNLSLLLPDQAGGDLYNYPSNQEFYYSLEDLSFATMSPIVADDSGLFPGYQTVGDDWMDQKYAMTDSAWNTDELWQFR